MAAKTLIWLLTIFITTSAQKLSVTPNPTHNLCESAICQSMESLKQNLEDCIVIIGNLEISIMETAKKSDFVNLTFPLLREVTGYVMVYRVQGLDTLGQLFPNLSRIRGEQLVFNYALIVFDMPSLVEIGLYSLRQIDRGGVLIRDLPQACFLDTVNWKTIAPRARHVIGSSDRLDKPLCNSFCTCSRNSSYNHCWNNMKCQVYANGFEDIENWFECNHQCLGCRQNNINECSTCRHYTHNGDCLPRCPNETIVLEANQFCLTEEECHHLNGWSWNNTCVFECPIDYVMHNTTTGVTCKYCAKCKETCPNQKIRSLGTLQAAEKCVYINGSLKIHIRAIPEAVKELKIFLSRVQEVTDYIEIYSSLVITSLDFLSSLQRIKGRKLKNDKYSLMIYDMVNLHTLFSPDVMKNLRIDRGTIKMYNNPMLCMSKVDELKQLFPEAPSELDVAQDTNGYSGGCEEAPVEFQITPLNETSVVLLFAAIHDPNIQYTVLYVRIPPDLNNTIVPETCSDFQWLPVNVPSILGQNGSIQIDSLRPASTYAICIETYDPVHQRLARSSILNFTTPVGSPEPPFIVELVASSHDLVVVRWVDHLNYLQYINRYELDVYLIEPKDITSIDYCKFTLHDFEEEGHNRHALVMRPPPDYETACESMCGVLSSFTAGALVEDFFDVCSHFDFDCNTQKDTPPINTTFKTYVKTMALNFSKSKSNNSFQIARLAPYSDYRFRLRACIDSRCSRSARGVVRTLKLNQADFPTIIYGFADETGYVSVKWDPPDTTNGPLLSYTVEILPKFEFEFDVPVKVLPQISCVSASSSGFETTSVLASAYSVRVCTTTLASINAMQSCSKWYNIRITKVIPWYWWVAVIFGVHFLLYITYAFLRKRYGMRQQHDDLIPIVTYTSGSTCESVSLT